MQKGEEKKYKPVTFSDDEYVDQRMLDNVRRRFFDSILQENPELGTGDIQKKQRRRRGGAKQKDKAKAKAKAKSKAKAKAKAKTDAETQDLAESAKSSGSTSAAASSNQRAKAKAATSPPESARKIGLNLREMPKLQESMSMLNAKPSSSVQTEAGSSSKTNEKAEKNEKTEKNEKAGDGGKSEKEKSVPKPARIVFKPLTPIFKTF